MNDLPPKETSEVGQQPLTKKFVDVGKKILEDSGLPIVSADNLADSAEKVVRVAREAC